ncbi:MAG: hypothetical protein COA99_16420 [Moraxellaceae bacterium]|nr:MAG: hypothetical protein COA99_16420 [Moraxellaceae bacterium]
MWRPTASLDAIRARATLYKTVRQFFFQRDVLEVETPLLCTSTAMDPYLESYSISDSSLKKERFLQTSPEFPMKRLLAAGSGSIYQIGKAFRRGEESPRHNPEFTMLEWYQPNFHLPDLQREVLDLVAELAQVFGVAGWGIDSVECLSYADLFESVVGLDPHVSSLEQLENVAKQHVNIDGDALTRDAWLDLLMSHVVEPKMPQGLLVLTDFPVGQAALAEIASDNKGRKVAKRFELYVAGLELANGYQELVDATEQRQRFEGDALQRQQNGVAQLPMPSHLIEALEAGMPPASGVAIGLDRLLMLLLGKQSLSEVLCFPWDRA